jgi:CDP-paratose 2-epimerase
MKHTRELDREVLRDVATESPQRSWKRPVLITGGAGFIGCNLAHRLLCEGRPVLIFDNLSRVGVHRNLEWLRATHGPDVEVEIADVRDRESLRHAVRWCAQVFHFAAQVAVTTSLVNPRLDYEVNVGGTLNLLEALRSLDQPPPLVFTSTNKVYGALDDVRLRRNGERWEPRDRTVRDAGIPETRPLDFHSPYGCSKGAADQYVRDYARSFGLPTVVFRMSCIYGPHQFGNEDQGWVAHFLLRARDGAPIDLYGDGMQVRDIQYVDDLVDALLLAQRHMPVLAGRAYNIGGGVENTVSLLELLDLIAELHGERPATTFHDWRVGDQRYYVSDISSFREATGWSPRVGVRAGVRRLYEWLEQSEAAENPDREVVAGVLGTVGDARNGDSHLRSNGARRAVGASAEGGANRAPRVPLA